MKQLIYKGSWVECLAEWDGGLVKVIDESGGYSTHSHFVQALRRCGVGRVFSRKGVCYLTGGDVNG